MQPKQVRQFLRGTSFRTKSLPRFYVAVCIVFGVFCLLKWPIFRGDTDLWYYLSGGRYLFQHHAIPHRTYFSFISPSRTWVNYSWLYQAVVYGLYLVAHYYALIVFRAGLYLGTCGMIGGCLFSNAHGRRSADFWPAFVLVLYALVLLPVYVTVRPQMVTYFFIATFLYVLECQPQHAFLLPWLSVLWCNFQGIDYPLIVLIAGAYTVEYFVQRARRATGLAHPDHRFILPVMLSMAAIYATPAAGTLIRLTSHSFRHLSPFVSELRPLSLDVPLSFHLVKLAPAYLTVVNVLLLAIGVAGLAALLAGRLKTSALVLLVGAATLLLRGQWFLTSAMLLGIPVVAAVPQRETQRIGRVVRPPVAVLLVGVLLVIPFRYVADLPTAFGGIPRRYPLSLRKLPVGVATFLEYLHVGGRVLNFPDSGGYLRWMLEPRYQIFVDNVEYPYLFTDRDCYIAQNAFFQADVLQSVVTRYEPTFISVPLQLPEFRTLVKQFPDYLPVFFDDAEVLYMHRRHHPEIASEYALTQVDPFVIGQGLLPASAAFGEPQALLPQLLRLHRIYPDGEIVNALIGSLYARQGAYEQGLAYARMIIRAFPGSPRGFWLAGDLLKSEKRFDEALASYRTALERLKEQGVPAYTAPLYQAIGSTELEKKDYQAAYRAFRAGVDVAAPQATRQALQELLAAALLSGHTEEAQQVAGFLSAHQAALHDEELQAH